MKAIAYQRVSTEAQGESGYGLDAQQAAITLYLKSHPDLELSGTYTEVESGRHNASKRPQLKRALSHCAGLNAVLVVAKLDRLARNAHFLLSLKEAGIEFVCCDMPDANRLTLGIMACLAEFEGEKIRSRTKEGIAAAMARGVKWGTSGKNHSPRHLEALQKAGNAARAIKADERTARLYPAVREVYDIQKTFRSTAKELNRLGFTGPGGGMWQAQTVISLLRRAGAIT